MYRRLIQVAVIFHINTVLANKCPSGCSCSENIIQNCTLSSFKDAEQFSNSTQIKELTIKSCQYLGSNTNLLNVSALRTKCDENDLYPLFVLWNLKTLSTELNNNLCNLWKTSTSNCSTQCKTYKNMCICTSCTLTLNRLSTNPSLRTLPTHSFKSVTLNTSQISTNKILSTNVNSATHKATSSFTNEPSKTSFTSSSLRNTTLVAKVNHTSSVVLQNIAASSTASNYSQSKYHSIAPVSITANRTTNTNAPLSASPVKLKYRFYFLIVTASLSALAISVNLVFIIHICTCKNMSLLSTLGLFMMLFNVILGAYGGVMTLYMYQEWLPEQRFCQGLSSLKIFALGANVWTAIMLSYALNIRASVDDKDEKDAVFKGIVCVLEGVMLAGVCSVMCWIKLDPWRYMCTIITPVSKVDRMLVGIEVTYYVILLLLLVRYPVYLYRRDVDQYIGRKKVLRKYQQAEGPVFLLVFISFVVWVVGYVLTLTDFFKLVPSFEMAAVVRVNTLLIAIIIQPLLFSLKHTCCCRPCWSLTAAMKNSDDDGMSLLCNCSGNERCAACEQEHSPRKTFNDTSFITVADVFNGEVKRRKISSTEETQAAVKKQRRRRHKTSMQKAICRSPVIRELTMSSPPKRFSESSDDFSDTEESTPLAGKVYENNNGGVSTFHNNTTPKENDIPEESEETSFMCEPSKSLDDNNLKENNIKKIEPVIRCSPPRTLNLQETPRAPLANPELLTPSSLESPRHRGASEFPSFISIDCPVETSEMSPNKRDLPLKPRDDVIIEERRWPLFYTISSKVERSAEDLSLLANNAAGEEGDEEAPLRGFEDNEKRFSEVSLEWDHSYGSSTSSCHFQQERVDVNANAKVRDKKLEDTPSPECGWEPYTAEESTVSSEMVDYSFQTPKNEVEQESKNPQKSPKSKFIIFGGSKSKKKKKKKDKL